MVKYKGQQLKKRLVIDLLIEGLVIVEAKAVIEMHPVFEAQLLTYLRQTEKRLGLLINFGHEVVKEGIRRVVHKL